MHRLAHAAAPGRSAPPAPAGWHAHLKLGFTQSGARIALTRLPHALAARYPGDSSEEAKALFVRVWSVLRPALTGSAAAIPRLLAT